MSARRTKSTAEDENEVMTVGTRVLHKYCAYVLDSLGKYYLQVQSLKYPGRYSGCSWQQRLVLKDSNFIRESSI
jgi:poly-beta-hydroxyalkanoate depolymerase